MKLEVLSITFAAGDVKPFAVAGRYIEVIESQWPIDLLFYDENGGQAGDARNVDSGVYITAGFAAFTIKSTLAQTVKLFITDGAGGSRRQPGTVQVVDGGRARSIGNVALIAGGAVSASAGNFSYLQVWNPAASGKRLIIKKMWASSSTAGDFRIATHNAALATLQGNPISKLNQNVIAAFDIRDGVSAGVLGQGVVRFLVGANLLQPIEFTEPMILEPGFSLIGGANTVNRDAVVSYEGYYESVA